MNERAMARLEFLLVLDDSAVRRERESQYGSTIRLSLSRSGDQSGACGRRGGSSLASFGAQQQGIRSTVNSFRRRYHAAPGNAGPNRRVDEQAAESAQALMSPIARRSSASSSARRAMPVWFGREELRTYQVFLATEKRLAPQSTAITVAALRFLCRLTLHED